jgi:hypothetical protein
MPADVPGEGGPRQWRVPPGLVALKLAGAGVLGVIALIALARRDPGQVLFAGLVAAGLGAFGVRDLLAPVRVAADESAVTVVAGFARRVRLPWSRIEAVRVDERSRYGLRIESLEIDAGESLHLFSANELGAPVQDVAEALQVLRAKPATGPPPPPA